MALGMGMGSVPSPTAVLDPTALSGYLYAPVVSLIRSSSKFWQDLAKTTLATAHNDPVAVMKDTYSGAEFTNSAGSARPLLQTDGTYWWLLFDGAATFLTGPAAAAWTDRQHAIFQACRPSAIAGYQVLTVAGTAANSFNLFTRVGTNPWGTYNGGDLPATSTLVNGTDYTLAMNGGIFWKTGAFDGVYTGSSGQAGSGEVTIGYQPTQGRYYAGRWYGGYFGTVPVALASNVAAITTWLGLYRP